MILVRSSGSRTVVRLVPGVLLAVTAAFSLPMIVYSLSHIARDTDADGKYFALFFGLAMLWVFLEFVATRETIELESGRLVRTVQGVFRSRQQVVQLRGDEEVGVERRTETSGTKRIGRQHLYLYTGDQRVPLNDPAKVYLDADRLARVLSEKAGFRHRPPVET